jgi:hypothetical protein
MTGSAVIGQPLDLTAPAAARSWLEREKPYPGSTAQIVENERPTPGFGDPSPLASAV